MDRWNTKVVVWEGGLITNEPKIVQGERAPGSLTEAINYEVGLKGGYRRISGFSKYSNEIVPGTGEVLGVFVHNDGVVACRDTNIYYGTGGSWGAALNSTARANAGKYRGTKYNWSGDTLVIVDGTNAPARILTGNTYTEINENTITSTSPTTYAVLLAGSTCVAEFKGHLFFGKGRHVTFSAPNDDFKYAPADGGGQFNVGQDIVNLYPWRDALYIFCKNSIHKISGNNAADFVLTPVTKNIGCLQADSVQEIGGDLVFLAPDGVRTVAGTERIGDIELSSISRQIQSLINRTGSDFPNGNVSSVVVREKSQYRLFSAREEDNEDDAEGFLGGLRGTSDGGVIWEWFELRGIKAACSHSDYIDNTEYVVHGGYDGYVYRQESGSTFDNRPIFSFCRGPWLIFDDPRKRKTIYKVKVFTELEGVTDLELAVNFDYNEPGTIQPEVEFIATDDSAFAIFDDINTKFDTDDVFDGEASPEFLVNAVGSGYSVSFAFTGNSSQAPHTLKYMEIEYGLGSRR